MPDGPPLRCLHYLDEFLLKKGGVVRAVMDMVGGLAAVGADVTLLTGDATDLPSEWRQPPGSRVPKVVTIDRRVTPFFRPQCGEALLDGYVADADVVHLHIAWDPFHRALAAAARRAGKPYVITPHGMLDDWCIGEKAFKKHAYLALGGRRLFQRAAGLHFTATSEQTQSMRYVGAGKPFVLPLAIDAGPFRQLVGSELARQQFPEAFTGDAPRLLFLGRVDPIKGLDVFVDALAKANTGAHAAPHLVLAGPSEGPYEAQLRARIDSAGLTERAHFLGMVGGDVKQSLYEACDAFVLPSHHENFGIALAEAMMCGAPALTSKCVNVWPEIKGFGALVVDHSVAGFKTGIEQLLAELTERKATAVANRQAVIDWVDHEKLSERYLDVYRRVIAGEAP